VHRALGAALTLWLLPWAARAQDNALQCNGQLIDEILIQSSAPTVAGLRNIPVAAGVVRTLHVTTRPDMIRRFLLLREGDTCSELRRAESERILRAQPFIADATIDIIASTDGPPGSIDLIVRTSDEIAVVLGGSVAADMPPVRAATFGNGNINGLGIYAAASWRYGGVFRTGFGGRLVDNQFLGRPYILLVEGHRNPLGGDRVAEVSHPYYTDIQRIAWQARAGGSEDYTGFQADPGDDDEHSLRVDRRYWDFGGIIRVGPPGRLSLFGASITGYDMRPAKIPVLITDNGLRPDPGSELFNRYEPHRWARVNALWGVRDIGFVRVHGFDALNANQDFPIGFQLGTMFGRSLSVLGSADDDIFMATDLFLGATARRTALRVQIGAEGRRNNDTNGWDGILTSAQAVGYVRASERNTLTGIVEWGAGWNQLIPFNLTLGNSQGGVRGYGTSETPGGLRLVGRIEDRVYLGRAFNLADVGIGVFSDAGRLWAGDIPYGTSTPVRPSIGLSLLGAVPPGSARLWRVDLAYALKPEAGGPRWELHFEGLDKTLFFLRQPSDIAAVREPTVPSSVFRWPR
jgi:hypothetical protein